MIKSPHWSAASIFIFLTCFHSWITLKDVQYVCEVSLFDFKLDFYPGG